MGNIWFSRYAFVVMVTVIIRRGFVESQNQYTINGDRDKAMDKIYLLKTPVMNGKTMDYCLGQCLQDCLCMSFQICLMAECQLCSSNKFRNSSALRSKKGCTNFVFQDKRSEENNQQCDAGCITSINCCMTSNPCYNGGTCSPRDNGEQNGKRRFTCKCPDGYAGYRCQRSIKSCRGYKVGNRAAGKYMVLGVDKAPYEVFCDFDANSSMTWTLIQSHQRDKDVIALGFNASNQNNISWNDYRLSKTRMESIQIDSTKWRATCQYQERGRCSDLVRGFNVKMDILIHKYGCFEVEYINVRGHSCSNCTVLFWQDDDYPLHFYSEESVGNLCEFHVHAENKTCADYFGSFYCIDTNHCCSTSPTSTTQIWFGGH